MARRKKAVAIAKSEAIGDRQYISIPDEMIQAQYRLITENPGISSQKLAELLIKKNARWVTFLFRKIGTRMLNMPAIKAISSCKTSDEATREYNKCVLNGVDLGLYELDLRVVSAIKRRINKDAGKTMVYSSRLIGYWPANRIAKHTLSIWLQQRLDRIKVEASMAQEGCERIGKMSTDSEKDTAHRVGNVLASIDSQKLAHSIKDLADTYGIRA